MEDIDYVNVTLEATSPYHHDFVFEDPVQRYILAAIVGCVAAIGIPGNCLVIAALATSKKLQAKTNTFVVELAVTDLATCLTLPFQIIALISDVWPLPYALCTFAVIVVLVGLWASVVNLAMIALNRYTLICHPRHRYDRIFSRRNLVVMLVFAWIIPSVVICVPPLFGIGGIGFSERYKVCTTIWTNEYSDIYAMVTIGAVQVPCLVIIVICYVKIYRHIVRQNCELRLRSNTISVAVFRRQVKVTKNLFIVFCSYILCIMPFSIASLIPPSYTVMPWVSTLLILNSCANPIIYRVNHPQFRVVFREIVTCTCNGDDVRHPSKSSHVVASSIESTTSSPHVNVHASDSNLDRKLEQTSRK